MMNIDTKTLEASVEASVEALIQQPVSVYEAALREALGRKAGVSFLLGHKHL